MSPDRAMNGALSSFTSRMRSPTSLGLAPPYHCGVREGKTPSGERYHEAQRGLFLGAAKTLQVPAEDDGQAHPGSKGGERAVHGAIGGHERMRLPVSLGSRRPQKSAAQGQQSAANDPPIARDAIKAHPR